MKRLFSVLLLSRAVGNMERCFSTKSTKVFNRDLKRKQREYALSLPDGDYYDYLRDESANNIADRVEDITRSFPKVLELGSYRGGVLSVIGSRESIRGSGGIGGVTDLTQTELANTARAVPHPLAKDIVSGLVTSNSVTLDEEEPLPFPDDTYDLVLSSLALHWVNDLPSALKEVKRVLKPDGAFVGSILGGDTLRELRYCLYAAEKERRGKAAPRASPMARASDVAALMQGAGFALPTIDVDKVTIGYPNAIALMEHLQHMGEGHAAFGRHIALGKDALLAAAALYQELYGLEDGSVEATFEIIYMIGWKPDASQPKACQRGSATKSLKELQTK